MATVDDIVDRHPDKGEFAESYRTADAEARELLNKLVDYALWQHPDIRVYPTDTPDLRLEVAGRVCATIEIKKRQPYLRLFLLNIWNALPNTRLKFGESKNRQLNPNVYINDKYDFSDAIRYVDQTIQNGRQL